MTQVVEAQLKQEALQAVDYVPAAAKVAGEIVQLPNGQTGVVCTGVATAGLGAAYVEGVFDVLCATGTTWSAGAPVYWDASTSLAVTAPGDVDDILLGTALVAKTTELVVRVKLNAGCGVGSIMHRGCWTSRVVSIDHADAAEHTLLAAAENPTGALLLAFIGEVTEASAGTSEDQLEITLYDEDDNVESVMISSGTPDAIGDILVGTRGVNIATSGLVIAKIAAGKSAYAKVTQATANGDAAGAISVRAIFCPLL